MKRLIECRNCNSMVEVGDSQLGIVGRSRCPHCDDYIDTQNAGRPERETSDRLGSPDPGALGVGLEAGGSSPIAGPPRVWSGEGGGGELETGGVSRPSRDTGLQTAGLRAPEGHVLFLHLKTMGMFTVPSLDRIVLGREALGADFLGGIKQISRHHCILERVGEAYAVSDAGSTYGTFIGLERNDCREHPGSTLRNGAVLVLGREYFQMILPRPDSAKQPASGGTASPALGRRTSVGKPRYECRDCGGFSSDSPPPDCVCPQCGTSLK